MVLNRLIGKALLAIVLSVCVSACGSSPTAPTAAAGSHTGSGSPAPLPDPGSSPTPPAPAPAPTPDPSPSPTPSPTPTPTPTPAPVPGPQAGSGWTFDGSTAEAQWSGAPSLPERFELEIANGSVRAADHTFPILSQAPDNVYVLAGTRNVETLTLEYYGPRDGSGSWRWTYSGLAGHATGTLQRHVAAAIR
jgi:hypothetical protein